MVVKHDHATTNLAERSGSVGMPRAACARMHGKNATILVVMLLGACGESEGTVALDPDLAVDVTTFSCAAPETPCMPGPIAIDRFGSSQELDTMLAGAWRFCGGGQDTDLFGAGLELTPDRELYVLEQAADGSCRRATPTPSADWYTFDISEQNPPGTYQLVLAWREDNSTTSLVPKFSRKATELADGFFGFEFRRLH
jgi:hypothetical protein